MSNNRKYTHMYLQIYKGQHKKRFIYNIYTYPCIYVYTYIQSIKKINPFIVTSKQFNLTPTNKQKEKN